MSQDFGAINAANKALDDIVEQDELLVLSGILLQSESFFEVRDVLDSEMFYRPIHRAIWQAICRLDASGNPFTNRSVSEEIAKTKEGGSFDDTLEYLVTGLGNSGGFADVEYHAKRVKQHWMRREIRTRAAELFTHTGMRNIGDSPQFQIFDFDEVLKINDALATVLDEATVTTADPLATVAKVKTNFETAVQEKQLNGYRSGHWVFDRNSLGFVPGSIGVEAAGTGEGKTHSLWHKCRNFKRACHENAGIISGEMTEEELVERQIVGDANLSAAMQGEVDPRTQQAVNRRLQEFAENPIEIVAPPSMKLDDVLGAVRHLARKKCCKLICIDYAQMISVPGERDPNEAAGRIYGELKALAMRYKIAIVMASQFNKAGRREQAKMSPLRITEADIYGSSHASYYSHTIVHIFRLSQHMHHTEIQRLAGGLQKCGVNPDTVTIERVLKSRRGMKQRYTMATQFKNWRMHPLDARAHSAIRDALRTQSEGETEVDPHEYFDSTSQRQSEAETSQVGF